MNQHLTNRHLRLFTAKGFTLIELLITMLVLAILAAMAGPALGSLLSKRQIDRAASEISRGIQLARSEAAKRAAPVRLQFVDEDDWSAGWQVIADINRDGDYDDDPVFQGEPVSQDIVIEATDDNDLSNDYLEFSAIGSVTPLGDRLALSIQDQHCDAAKIVTLSVSSNGEITSESEACTD